MRNLGQRTLKFRIEVLGRVWAALKIPIKRGIIFGGGFLVKLHSSSRLRRDSLTAHLMTSAAKAVTQSKGIIAALKRCATQNQVQHRILRKL